MIIELAYTIGGLVVALVLGAAVAKGLLGQEFVGNTFTQIVFGGIAGYALVSASMITLTMAVAIPVGVIASKVLILVYFWRIAKGALSGKYGQETQWVAEMISDDDEQFKEALDYISATDREEIKIIAESKDELREEVIERAEERAPKKLSDSGD